MKTGDTVQRFSYDAQGKVVSVNYNGTEYYYLRNAQGDIVKLIDGSGNTVVEYTYDSWGKVLSVTGSLATTLGENQPFRYRGYVYDTETGWYYLQSRYYNPETCRFISSDVYLSTGQGVLGHNSYAYCRNNPTNRKDTNGNTDDELWPDYTEELIELLINNYCKAQLWSIVPSYAQIKFYNYVKSRGKWDYKANPPDWMPSDKKFSAFGCNMTAADLGNLNYGMTGMVVGFSRQTLLTAGGFVAVTEDGDSNGILYYYDGKDDYFFINLGITLCEAINPLYALSSTTFDLSLNMGLNGRAGLAVYKKTRKLISSTWKNTSLLPILLPF